VNNLLLRSGEVIRIIDENTVLMRIRGVEIAVKLDESIVMGRVPTPIPGLPSGRGLVEVFRQGYEQGSLSSSELRRQWLAAMDDIPAIRSMSAKLRSELQRFDILSPTWRKWAGHVMDKLVPMRFDRFVRYELWEGATGGWGVTTVSPKAFLLKGMTEKIYGVRTTFAGLPRIDSWLAANPTKGLVDFPDYKEWLKKFQQSVKKQFTGKYVNKTLQEELMARLGVTTPRALLKALTMEKVEELLAESLGRMKSIQDAVAQGVRRGLKVLPDGTVQMWRGIPSEEAASLKKHILNNWDQVKLTPYGREDIQGEITFSHFNVRCNSLSSASSTDQHWQIFGDSMVSFRVPLSDILYGETVGLSSQYVGTTPNVQEFVIVNREHSLIEGIIRVKDPNTGLFMNVRVKIGG